MESAPEHIDVVAEVKKLALPEGSYLVFGSGILTALGIRESADIDLLVTPELFDDLKAQGWNVDSVTIEGRERARVSRGVCEAFKEYWCQGNDYDVAAMIKNAVLINNVPFMRLEDLVVLKTAMGREKDLKDIVLIEEYQRAHPGQVV